MWRFATRGRASTFSFGSPASYMQRRFFRVWHYTSEENAAAIEKSGQLNPGDGNLGPGVYATTHQPGVASHGEIGLAIRHPKLPYKFYKRWFSFDTDDLEAMKIPYRRKGSTVVVDTKTPLRLKSVKATSGDTPPEKDPFSGW